VRSGERSGVKATTLGDAEAKDRAPTGMATVASTPPLVCVIGIGAAVRAATATAADDGLPCFVCWW
jgi:hypothetical protein